MEDKKQDLEQLSQTIKSLIDSLELFLPAEFSLNELAQRLNVHKDTIAKHLKANYLESKDYRYTSKNGKIFVARETALKIKDYYEQKRAS